MYELIRKCTKSGLKIVLYGFVGDASITNSFILYYYRKHVGDSP